MKEHAIIPIFIPHRGCPHDCVFCNQKAITQRRPDVTPADARAVIEQWLSTLSGRGLRRIEIAFYGGSFTGLPLEEQAAFLEVAHPFLQRQQIHAIRLSTRPDFISEPVLEQLRRYHVETVELGVQSFDPEVLAASRRGHTAEQVEEACRMIRDHGFRLGIQLMIGLPEDSHEKCVASARRAVRLRPDDARLYPTMVLEDTALAELWRRGEYRPLTTEEAIRTTKDMYRILRGAGVNIIRVGLKSSDMVGRDEQILVHPCPPAFRQLVEGEIAREDLEAQIEELLRGAGSDSGRADGSGSPADSGDPARDSWSRPDRPLTALTCACHPDYFSAMVGNGKKNKRYFAEKYPYISIRYAVDPDLPAMTFRARSRD